MRSRAFQKAKTRKTPGWAAPAWSFLLCAASLLAGTSLAQESPPEFIDPLSGIYRVEPDQTAEIMAHGLCKQITNRNADPILVPTRLAEEWSIGSAAFLILPPVGVEVAPCVTQPIDQILTSFTVSPFVDLDGQSLNAITYSNVAELRGDVDPMPFSISGGPEAAASINDGAWVNSGIIQPGDTIRLRARTADAYNATVATELDVAEYTGTWNASTGSVQASCSVHQVTASAGSWGTWWGDRLSVLWAGSMPGRTAVQGSSTFCGFTGPVPVEILGYEETVMSGTLAASGGNPTMRINGGPEVTKAIYTPGDTLEILYDTADGHALSVVTMRFNGFGTGSYGYSTVSAKPGLSLPASFSYGTKTAGWSASMVSNAHTLSGGTSSSTWYPTTMEVVSAPWTWTPTISMTASSGPSTAFPAAVKIIKNGVEQASLPVTAAVGDTIALKLKAPASGTGTMQYRMVSTSGGRLGGSSDYFVANFDGALSSGNFNSVSSAKNTTVTSNSLWAAPLSFCQTGSVNVPTGFNSLSTTINVNGVNRGKFGVSICNGDEVKLITKTPSLGTGVGNFTLTVSGWTKTWSVSY